MCRFCREVFNAGEREWGARRPRRFPSVRHDIVGAPLKCCSNRTGDRDMTGPIGKLAPRGAGGRLWKNRERKTEKLLRKEISRLATVAVDNPHRRCSGLLGHVSVALNTRASAKDNFVRVAPGIDIDRIGRTHYQLFARKANFIGIAPRIVHIAVGRNGAGMQRDVLLTKFN